MVNLDNLFYSYQKSQAIFNNLNLNIKAGHIYGLLGENGVGKTTLLKLITGELKPRSGTCNTMGFDPTKRSPEMLEKIFHVPEKFTLPSMTAKEFINSYAGFYPNFDKQFLDKYSVDAKIPITHTLSRMSMGQQKKFAIGFGLACKTPLLILDEPTNGLDIPSKSHFRKMLIDSSTEERSIIISTHQVRDINNLIDQVILLDRYSIFCNEDISSLTKKMKFIQTRSLEDLDIIYYESTYGIHNLLVTNDDSQNESNFDLELFFNASIHARQKLIEILNKK